MRLGMCRFQHHVTGLLGSRPAGPDDMSMDGAGLDEYLSGGEDGHLGGRYSIWLSIGSRSTSL